jgi:hypothetical protein
VLQPPKEWRSNVEDRHRFVNEIDLFVNDLRVSVKSRKVRFTCPEDIPDNRNPLFVDTERKWAKKTPPPFAIVSVSQETEAAIWLNSLTEPQWVRHTRHDAMRGYSDIFMAAPRELWQPLETLPEAITAAFDGIWELTTNSTQIQVAVEHNLISAGPQKFIGQPLKNLIGWLNCQGGLRAQRK